MSDELLSMKLPDTSVDLYNYLLPEANIAQFPAENRENSRLLLATSEPFNITRFSDIGKHIPNNSLLIFNETRVIPARLVFLKPTGARIEVFLLHPIAPADYQEALSAYGSTEWKVLIGNAAKWKGGDLNIVFCVETGSEIVFTATRTGPETVRFSWHHHISFGSILDHLAQVPLPPYIHRSNNETDRERYQTVFARNEGSVAAPTAGLHFTEKLLHELTASGIQQVALTLHVGLGTFRPVKDSIANHTMHNEPFYISHEQLKMLAGNAARPWTVVGTTSLRALESLYTYGCKLLNKTEAEKAEFEIAQWDKWNSTEPKGVNRQKVFETLLALSEKHGNTGLSGNTSLIILKGKPVRTADYLITNFHQPKSTLLMLVDAFASVNWTEAYQYALSQNMRFLSYGDACLFRNKNSVVAFEE